MNDAGKIGFTIRGAYDPTETYEFLDLVYYQGSTYAVKRTVTGVTPVAHSDDYELFSQGYGLSDTQSTSTLTAPTSRLMKDTTESLETAIEAKQDSATTLAGYGITDAYTKDEVDDGLAAKQNTLTAGEDIDITGTTISAKRRVTYKDVTVNSTIASSAYPEYSDQQTVSIPGMAGTDWVDANIVSGTFNGDWAIESTTDAAILYFDNAPSVITVRIFWQEGAAE